MIYRFFRFLQEFLSEKLELKGICVVEKVRLKLELRAIVQNWWEKPIKRNRRSRVAKQIHNSLKSF